ncbi:hypothetical protein OIDMADRAFT_55824 [Oidiodendron maius Zn]|uniref:Major facilitator superfamily (MFS) profile domain-containing protein n=1 Tax=Oidiodendron maius (strain Zn) TaxID=913774 RepID=A0A0C3GUZ8_OIDMZ|nr:hypothetical protein OIDMADRAFT_55824 [Oidiodendron maius Zn]
MSTGFVVSGFIALILNLFLVEEIEDEGAIMTEDMSEDTDDQWEKVHRLRRSDQEQATELCIAFM